MNLNLKVRLKNPIFLIQLVLALFTPILSYAGITMQELTSWSCLFQLLTDALRSPYVCSLIVISIWNAINDPTTDGLSDSSEALTYTKPKK